MNQCKICNELKSKTAFPKSKGNTHNDNLSYTCKECRSSIEKKRRLSKKYVVKLIYSNQKVNSIARGHDVPTYSREELLEWLYSQYKFHVLYDNWKRLDYQKEYKPSVDRIDDNIGYTMANIQLMTFGENFSKAMNDLSNGKTDSTKSIMQYSREGEFIAEYVSSVKAEQSTGISRSAICYNLNGKTRHSGGYIWKYKERNYG